jgi:hypothetical protein
MCQILISWIFWILFSDNMFFSAIIGMLILSYTKQLWILYKIKSHHPVSISFYLIKEKKSYGILNMSKQWKLNVFLWPCYMQSLGSETARLFVQGCCQNINSTTALLASFSRRGAAWNSWMQLITLLHQGPSNWRLFSSPRKKFQYLIPHCHKQIHDFHCIP